MFVRSFTCRVFITYLSYGHSTFLYVALADVDYTSTISLCGHVHLILSDDIELKITVNDGSCITADDLTQTRHLTVYSQSMDDSMGKLTLSNNENYYYSIFLAFTPSDR